MNEKEAAKRATQVGILLIVLLAAFVLISLISISPKSSTVKSELPSVIMEVDSLKHINDSLQNKLMCLEMENENLKNYYNKVTEYIREHQPTLIEEAELSVQ
jgi:hypothetical protein